MTDTNVTIKSANDASVHALDGLQTLLDVLVTSGYEVLAPNVVDGVVAIRPTTSVDQLPWGWSDDQQPGAYRLRRVERDERFGYAVGAQSWKPLLHRPRVQTLSITQKPRVGAASGDEADEVRVDVVRNDPHKRAFLGVRPCELAAIGRHDTVLRDGEHPDREYGAARSGTLIIAVDCTRPAATCFCASMGTGPLVTEDSPAHDLRITEIVARPDQGDAPIRYRLAAASAAGRLVVDAVRAQNPGRPADAGDEADVADAADTAVASMVRHVTTDGLPEMMLESYAATRWESIAERCLACGNCTSVCPTCFCTKLLDVTDLSGAGAERWREWDTCYSSEFSRLGGDVVRTSVSSRYRQWLVHKLGTWHDQFGESGCVGCGRCITWCPVGIDLTEELPLLHAELRGS